MNKVTSNVKSTKSTNEKKSTKKTFKDNLKYQLPEQDALVKKFTSLLDEYQKSNSFENREFLCYLTAAIYLTHKKLFPQLNIHIPFRAKGDLSFIRNINKEFSQYIKDSEQGEDFDFFNVTNDLLGMRIVLDNINRSLPREGTSQTHIISNENQLNIFDDPEVYQLLEESEDNFKFADKLLEALKSPILNGDKYYKLRTELLERIIKITPAEFTKEAPKSFERLLEDTKDEYEFLRDSQEIPTNISEFQRADITSLASTFRHRIEDQLQFAILRRTLPVVFNDPLIKNALKTNFEFRKESKKPNGFQALYYNLNTPFGPVEVQAQSNKAYDTQLKGSAYHSGLSGKQVPVKNFFELVNPDDEESLSYYLDTLDAISMDSLISPYEIPEFNSKEEKKAFMKTPTGKFYAESNYYREMMKHIKIKEEIQLSNGTTMNTDEYLISTALSLSPYMNVCSSGHTSFTTASIHNKKVIGEFAEILRKKDSNTCLREMLIRKLEDIIATNLTKDPKKLTPNMAYSIGVIREHSRMAENLPKDISKKNIINYAERLKIIEENKDGFALE